MTDREVMQQALEALENGKRVRNFEGGTKYQPTLEDNAITALKAALEQQAEPVQETEAFGFVTVRRLSQRFENHHDQYQFYPAGQIPYLDNVDECHTVYTAPPQRKPLTDEMVHKAMIALNTQSCGELQPTFEEMKVAIEAAHGIKENI